MGTASELSEEGASACSPLHRKQLRIFKRQTPNAKRQTLIFPTFIAFILFDSVLMLVAGGCEGRGDQGLPRARSLSPAEEPGGQSSLPLVPSAARLNLGRVAPGSQKALAFWLTNRSAAPVDVVEITSSCDCLRVDLPERNLVPGQKVEGRIELDLRKERQFLGNLCISVKGRGKNGEMVFAMEVHVEVDKD
jgi:hypothetical protein